jgi:hypothetical protein
MMATRTRVAWVVVFVKDFPLKSLGKVLVFMAVPKRERIARELKKVK